MYPNAEPICNELLIFREKERISSLKAKQRNASPLYKEMFGRNDMDKVEADFKPVVQERKKEKQENNKDDISDSSNTIFDYKNNIKWKIKDIEVNNQT